MNKNIKNKYKECFKNYAIDNDCDVSYYGKLIVENF